MIFQNTIVQFISLFIPDREMRHSFRKRYKRRTKYRKLRDDYLLVKSSVERIEQRLNVLEGYMNTLGRITYFSAKSDIVSPVFYSAKEIWEFIDSKGQIGSVYTYPCASYEIFFNKKLVWVSDINPANKTELYLYHGPWVLYHIRPTHDRMLMINNCLEFNIPLCFEEEAFVHSITATNIRKNRVEYRTGYSMIVDSVSNHFDATSHTSIEGELNSDISYTKVEIQRAKNLIGEIVKNKISKYNGQPLVSDLDINVEDYKTVVLVIDQAFNDYSILKGYADANTFTRMLDTAIDENQDALILVKVHPDMINDPTRGSHGTNVSRRHGHFTNYVVKEADRGRVRIIGSYANAYTILDLVDKVYVCSSLMGFEAMMAGKEVHIWGSPFYAGWGIGVQRTRSPAIERRTKKRSLEEIFVCAYLNFSKYIDPFKYERCELEDLIKAMIALRERYFAYQEQLKSNFENFREPVLSEEIPVVFAAEEKNHLQTAVAIATLLASDPQNSYYVYCISTGQLPDKAQAEISDMAKTNKNLAGIEFLASGHDFGTDIGANPNISSTELIKLNIHNIINKKQRVIYSNSNVVFLRGLSHAWESSAAFDSFIAAAPDLNENRTGAIRDAGRSYTWKKYFAYSQGRYVNGGLIVMNLDKIRKEIDDNAWIDCIRNPDALNATDIINLVCNPKIHYLSCRYASNTDFNFDDSSYRELFNEILPPEDLMLLKEKTVAVQYPSDSPPWKIPSVGNSGLWDDLVRKNPALNKILKDQ